MSLQPQPIAEQQAGSCAQLSECQICLVRLCGFRGITRRLLLLVGLCFVLVLTAILLIIVIIVIIVTIVIVVVIIIIIVIVIIVIIVIISTIHSHLGSSAERLDKRVDVHHTLDPIAHTK